MFLEFLNVFHLAAKARQTHVIYGTTALPPGRIHRVVLSWVYQPAGGGLPAPYELGRMQAFEQALAAGLGAPQLGVQASSLTEGGLRVWHYYTAHLDAFLEVMYAVQAAMAAPALNVQFYPDPEWGVVRQDLHVAPVSRSLAVPA